MAALDDLASKLFGSKRAESNIVSTDATTRTYVGTATSASEDGSVYVALSQDVTLPDDDDGTHGLGVEMPTTVNVDEGDEVIVTVFGGGTMKAPVVTGNPGWGDRMQAQVDNAEELAQQAEDVAQEAAEEVEQVRQDVADFRDDVATTYATKVERQDGDDAVKTWVTTNYTNSNDLATTYATKTLVSQTKDAIELAASQTYETQSDAAATYATKAALTVGLDGIRSEVAEDYQPKGDYATTASMNSAIQQSASSIESSVAATYETKSDAAATYATKTEVQQTASGLDTRITTATNTANSAKSAVDNLQVGGTNLLWDSAFDDIANTWLKWGTPTTYEVVNVNGVNFLHVKTSGVRFQGIQQNDSKRAGVGEISAGEKFVFSVDAYGATSTQLNVGIHWLNSSHGVAAQNWFAFNIGTTPKRYVHVDDLTAPTNAVAFNIMIGNNTTDVREVWFAHPKLERGTIATDWSPAPEDMATEADLQAEVTERQTLIRQFSGGVLAGYVGNLIAALVNAAGSFDVVQTTWTNGVPSVLGTLSTFGANLIRIGEETGQNILITSAGQLFRDGLNNLMALTTGAAYTETFEIRADEDNYYILEHKPMVVESVTIDGTATDDYQWMNYDWNLVPTGGGTLALGYDTWYDNPGSTLSVTYRTSPAMTIYDGLGNLAANIQSYFTATEIGLGGNIYEDMAHKWYQHANVRFFGATDSLGSSVESTYAYDVGTGYISWNDSLNLAGRISDANAPTVNGSASASGLETLRYIYDDSESSDDYRSESTSILFASSEGGTDPSDMATAQARLGVKTVTVGNTYERAFVCVDEMNVTTRQAIVGLTQPGGTYVGTNNTTTATSSGWRITWFNTRIAGTAGNFGENYYTFSNGVVTLLKACVLEFSGVMNWTDSVAGNRGFGIFKGSSTVSSGREWSAFQMFPSGTGTRKSVVLPPIMLPCTAGEKLAIGRYEQTNAVYVNGENFSWITIRVVEDRSSGTGGIDYPDEAMG